VVGGLVVVLPPDTVVVDDPVADVPVVVVEEPLEGCVLVVLDDMLVTWVNVIGDVVLIKVVDDPVGKTVVDGGATVVPILPEVLGPVPELVGCPVVVVGDGVMIGVVCELAV